MRIKIRQNLKFQAVGGQYERKKDYEYRRNKFDGIFVFSDIHIYSVDKAIFYTET